MQRLAYLVLLALPLLGGCGSQSPGENQADAPEKGQDSLVPPETRASETQKAAPVATFDMNAVKALIPEGYRLVESEEGPPVLQLGELNGDGNLDVVVLLERPGTDLPHSAILVGYGEEDGGFHMGGKTGNWGPEPLTYADPGMFSFKDQVLTVTYQSMRWGIDLKFRLERMYGDLRLIGTESTNFGNAMGDGAGGASTNFLTGIRVSHYKRWDEEKGEVWLPETRDSVSRDLLPLAGFNDDMIYELQ